MMEKNERRNYYAIKTVKIKEINHIHSYFYDLDGKKYSRLEHMNADNNIKSMLKRHSDFLRNELNKNLNNQLEALIYID